MLIDLVKINGEVLSLVCEHLTRTFGSSDDEVFSKVSGDVPELCIVSRVLSKLQDVRDDIVKRVRIEEFFQYLMLTMIALQEIPDIDEDLQLALDIVSAVDPLKADVANAIMAIPDRRATSIAARVSEAKSKVVDLSKKLRDVLITSRDALRIYTEVLNSRLLKDKFSGILAYITYKTFQGTDYELGNISAVPAHVDIHVIKVLLRLGILQIDREILQRYTGSGKYVARILPIYAKLAPDEPYKTLWDVLRRRALDVFKQMCENTGITQLTLSYLLSNIGRRICLFNDDYSSVASTCPIKGLRTCPLSVPCRSYAGLVDIRIFSRRQARILLRYLGMSSRTIEEVACELIMV